LHLLDLFTVEKRVPSGIAAQGWVGNDPARVHLPLFHYLVSYGADQIRREHALGCFFRKSFAAWCASIVASQLDCVWAFAVTAVEAEFD